MLWKTLIVWLILLFSGFVAHSQASSKDFLVYHHADQMLSFSLDEKDGLSSININCVDETLIYIDGQARWKFAPTPAGQILSIKDPTTGKVLLYHCALKKNGQVRLIHIPLWYSIFPPLVAIFLALLLKEVTISLFVGVWTGAFIAGGMRLDSFFYFVLSILQVVEKYVIQALNDSGHLSVIVFSLLIGGMVAIISRNGGMSGVVQALSRYAKSPRSAQFITWLLGVAIFFDDYANTLIVGNTMRSVTDRFRISREKLAYLVDSTAAPVASVAFITTWIGAELGYIDGGISQIEDFSFQITPYAVFIASLKYSFYPVLTLLFILMLIHSGKDFGPMHAAEVRARSTGQVSSATDVSEDEPDMEDLSPVANAPRAWQHAVFPVLCVILMTVLGLVATGMEALQSELALLSVSYQGAGWSEVWSGLHLLQGETQIGFFRKLGILIGSADSYVALLWASLTGLVWGIVVTLYRKIMNLTHTMHTMVTGFKTMMPALIILTLAWALAITTEELHTASFLSSALESSINPYFLPMVVFVLAALIAFSTGSSWSTMAILYPIAIPTTWAICQHNGIADAASLEILLNVISIVMGASVLGDHCSPMSDTTILSSLASDCNHIDHVRTQLPYAITVGAISLACAGLSTYLGGGWLISLMLVVSSLFILYLLIMKVGRVVGN